MAAPAALMTKLEGVNEILSNAGYATVTALASGSPGPVGQAEAELDRQTREVLAMGWWFNMQPDYVMTINASNEINIPAEVIKIEAPGNALIMKFDGGARKLFSKATQSFEFSNDVTVRWAILSLPFEEMPYEAQDYVVKKAQTRFQMKRIGDRETHRQNLLDERDARADLIQQEGEQAEHNIRLNPSLREHLRRPLGRGSSNADVYAE